jgi:hypothetical protein
LHLAKLVGVDREAAAETDKILLKRTPPGGGIPSKGAAFSCRQESTLEFARASATGAAKEIVETLE